MGGKNAKWERNRGRKKVNDGCAEFFIICTVQLLVGLVVGTTTPTERDNEAKSIIVEKVRQLWALTEESVSDIIDISEGEVGGDGKGGTYPVRNYNSVEPTRTRKVEWTTTIVPRFCSPN